MMSRTFLYAAEAAGIIAGDYEFYTARSRDIAQQEISIVSADYRCRCVFLSFKFKETIAYRLRNAVC